MADTILTLKKLEDIFRKLTCTLLGLNPVSPANNGKVRIAWPTGGAPGWKITEDVVFLRVVSIANSYSKQRDVEYSLNSQTEANKITSYTLPRQVSWIAYGPNSFDNIEAIRNGLFSAGDILRASNLHLVIDVPVPIRCPDLFSGQWWERSDFSAMFYEKVRRQETIPTLHGVNIKIKTEKGVTIDVDSTT
ncbi:hypothetical protein E4K67_22435 [Desulfosporosinus fructosivorans]|uniref:Phage neck terminator protein gp12-like domain-containing protein n=1 Tax=Desulfosporosinus fructosivorans TaxID=2018669 RepID=A0A4Z0R1K8_9FIRM|nr:hypothetical protein [Desulfosporosinus fructosivorans]TGE35877.1 hypothetical protein E4K67_22435 [Desulfosporosinus fructosivorans]